jgi:hypothetical protein
VEPVGRRADEDRVGDDHEAAEDDQADQTTITLFGLPRQSPPPSRRRATVRPC